MHSKFYRFLPLIALFLILHFSLCAQVTTSGIIGNVSNNTSAALEGASIKAIHQPTGSVYNTIAGKGGNFTLPNMRVGGPYKIEITNVGYEPQVYDSVYLQLGEETRLTPMLLTTANELSGVTIGTTRKNALISKERTGTVMQISQQQLQALPTITRNVNDYARLLPQAQSRANADGSTAGISFAGQSNKYNQFTVDGANSSDIFGLSASGTNGGQASINPIPFDAIEQIQVILAPYDVMQGGFTGGGINAVTRSGTNNFHGSIYGFNQNQSLVGKSPNDKSSYGNFHDNTFGARLGGPIVKDKLFFFANYEGERRSAPGANQPGDAGSNIDITKVQALSDWLKNEGEHPGWKYDPGPFNGINQTRNSDALFARLDWNINDKNKLTIRHSFATGKNLIFSDGQNSMQFLSSGYYFKSTNNSTVIELNSNISEKHSNLLRLTLTETRDSRQIAGDPFPFARINDGALSYTFGADNNSQANKLSQNIYTLVDNYTIYAGAHTITLGTNNEFYNIANTFIQNLYGNYTYNNPDDFYNNAAPKSYQHFYPAQQGSDGAVKMNAAQFSLYGQDAYRVSDNFKLTYGLRLDMPVFFTKPGTNEVFNHSEMAMSKNVATDQLPGLRVMFSPRAGFNWDVKNDRQTQVRGGAGLFTGRPPLVWIANQYSSTGVLLNKYTAPASDLANITFDPNNPSTGAGSKVNEIDVTAHNFKFTQTLRGNLAIDQKLPYGFVGTIEGIITKTLSDIKYTDLNLAPSRSNLSLDNSTRPFYGSKVDAANYSNVLLLGNTSKGYAYSFTIQIQKPFSNGWNASLAYSLGHSFGLNDGTSTTAASNYRFAYNVNGAGNLDLAHNNYDPGSAVKGYISKRFEYAKGKLYSQIGLVYNGISGQKFSYVYLGDINGDDGTTATFVNTSGGNDLIYLPTSAADFAPVYAKNSAGKYILSITPEDQYKGFQDYMNTTGYTKENQGKNTARNGARLPWENHFDLKFVQGVKFAKGHALELSLNVFNISNMISNSWGRSYFLMNQEAQPLNVANPTKTGYDASVPADQQYTTFDPEHPKITFNPATGLNKYTGKPWGYSDFLSRWNMQIGLRYSF